MEMSYKEAAEVLRHPDENMRVWEDTVVLTSAHVKAIEVALEALEHAEELERKYAAAVEAAAIATELAAKYRKVDGDLISRAELLKFPIRRDHYDRENGNPHFINGIETVMEYAEALPAVAAEPVVHAHWMFYEDGTGDWWDKCSGCGGKLPNSGGYCCDLPRCPECGAHMDEEVEHGK